MLTALVLGVRARRPLLHVIAFLGVLVACLLISAVPIPAAAPDPFTDRREHLAYGYLYFPAAVLPIVSSFVRSPLDWAEQQAGRRAADVDAAVLSLAVLAAGSGAAAAAFVAGDPGGWILALTNMSGVLVMLVIALRFLDAQWAWIPGFAYLAAGLTLPTSPVLVLNREESPSRLLSAAVLLILALALRHRGVLRRRG